MILRESRRERLAHQFLDYLLRPAVSARIVESTKTASANAAARNLLPEAVRETPRSIRRRTWSRAANGRRRCPRHQRLRDRIWTEIKSSYRRGYGRKTSKRRPRKPGSLA